MMRPMFLCETCGMRPVLELWTDVRSGGGRKFGVCCNNPERLDLCDAAFYYSLCDDPNEAIERWNEYQTSIRRGVDDERVDG